MAETDNLSRDRLGDNWMGPADQPLSDWVMGATYANGVTPDAFNGSPKEKEQYAAYYAKRKAA